MYRPGRASLWAGWWWIGGVEGGGVRTTAIDHHGDHAGRNFAEGVALEVPV